MKKDINRFIKLYTVSILLSIVIHGCCDDETIQIVGKGTFLAFEIDEDERSTENQIGTVTDEFKLFARFETNLSISSHLKSDMISSAYATSCITTDLNRLVQESLIISINRDFIFDDQTVAANSNLLDIPEVENLLSFEYDSVLTLFTNEFISKSVFEDEEYTFTIQIDTTDGLTLENEVTLAINL